VWWVVRLADGQRIAFLSGARSKWYDGADPHLCPWWILYCTVLYCTEIPVQAVPWLPAVSQVHRLGLFGSLWSRLCECILGPNAVILQSAEGKVSAIRQFSLLTNDASALRQCARTSPDRRQNEQSGALSGCVCRTISLGLP
jgi:hypothetical protein